MASHVDRVQAVTNTEKVWAGREKRNIWKTTKTISKCMLRIGWRVRNGVIWRGVCRTR